MTQTVNHNLSLAQRIADRYSQFDLVEAVVLAGSNQSGFMDADSDIDLYVYSISAIPIKDRAKVAKTASCYAEIDNRFWEPGDEWIDAGTEMHVDIMFRNTDWIEDQLSRVLQRCKASVGYSTCFWFNVLSSQGLFDRNGWYASVQQTANRPFPKALQRAIIARNHPILRRNLSSYVHQLETAARRRDMLSLNHRVTVLLASYFDILFAVNCLPHPGEKRLLEFAHQQCRQLPEHMSEQVTALIQAVAATPLDVPRHAEALIANLDVLLDREGLLPD